MTPINKSIGIMQYWLAKHGMFVIYFKTGIDLSAKNISEVTSIWVKFYFEQE